MGLLIASEGAESIKVTTSKNACGEEAGKQIQYIDQSEAVGVTVESSCIILSLLMHPKDLAISHTQGQHH